MPANCFSCLVDQQLEDNKLFDVISHSKQIISISNLAKQLANDGNVTMLEVLDLSLDC